MKPLFFVLLFSAGFAVAQGNTRASAPDHSKYSKGQVTIQGCVSRSQGDYILIKQDPGVTYELQATGKVRLHDYLGQRVEVTGEEGPSLSSSSDAINKVGSASSTTITVSSIKTIAKECPSR